MLQKHDLKQTTSFEGVLVAIVFTQEAMMNTLKPNRSNREDLCG